MLLINQFHKFIVFFPATLLVYHLTSRDSKWAVLLIASYWLFISLDPTFWWILPVITLVPYLIGPVLERLSCQRHRKLVFTAGILFTLTPLLFFKYSNYSINQLVIPLGISFYTFQSLAYLTSVYKRQTKPYLHFGLLALHIAFFTHLLAGPIVSPNDLIPQLRAPARVSKKLRDQGLRLISFGLFKKFAIANNLEVFGTTALAFPEKYAGFPLLLATILLLYRLYFDFSGYTDIAQGASLLFGIQLPRSFDNPFAARSISDFWRRWNITLVSWFREHVYFPLSRQWSSHFGIRAALVLTMILVGLWHAPTWPWLAFGVTNGVLLILDSHTGSFRTELAERPNSTIRGFHLSAPMHSRNNGSHAVQQ